LVLGQNPAAAQVECACEAGAVIDETSYELLQFHLHCPSEHTFDGTCAPMALHLVHRAADGRLAVVAVMFEEGPPNPAMAVLVSALGQADAPAEIDLGSLLPAVRAG
jgi:carbonic anhydrase